MCPNCRAFITNNDRTCPYCNERVQPKAVDLRNAGAMIGGLIPHGRFTTSIILLINFGLFLATSLGGTDLQVYGAKDATAILGYHQWYRLVTAGFLHGNLLHILMNSWVLFDLGAQVEELYGPPRLTVIYFLSSVGGFLASTYFKPFAPSVGSSAGIMGLIGAMIALGVRNKTSMGQAIRAHYVRWAVYGLIFGLLPGIDNIAHVGGIAAGFGVAYAAGLPIRSTAPVELFWRVGAIVCVVLTALSFLQLYLHFAAGAVR